MPIKIVEKIWGREEWLVNNDRYCMKKLFLHAGFQCSYHHHREKDETFVVEQGRVYLNLEGEDIVLKQGDLLRIMPGQRHSFASLTLDAMMFEVSTHHEESDSYRETESGHIDLKELKDRLIKKGLF